MGIRSSVLAHSVEMQAECSLDGCGHMVGSPTNLIVSKTSVPMTSLFPSSSSDHGVGGCEPPEKNLQIIRAPTVFTFRFWIRGHCPDRYSGVRLGEH